VGSMAVRYAFSTSARRISRPSIVAQTSGDATSARPSEPQAPVADGDD